MQSDCPLSKQAFSSHQQQRVPRPSMSHLFALLFFFLFKFCFCCCVSDLWLLSVCSFMFVNLVKGMEPCTILGALCPRKTFKARMCYFFWLECVNLFVIVNFSSQISAKDCTIIPLTWARLEFCFYGQESEFFGVMNFCSFVNCC